MCEYAWWYLFVQILNVEADRKNEINKLIETLLPWINPELWSEYQKQKGKGQENIAFEEQVKAMMDGTFSSDPNAPAINLDEFHLSDVAKQRVAEQQSSGGQQQRDQGSFASNLFDQYKGSIRDHLFPDQGPTFQGTSEDIPPEYKDFYDNLPDVKEFPPEKPPEDDS